MRPILETWQYFTGTYIDGLTNYLLAVVAHNTTKLLGGILVSLCPSVRPSVLPSVRLSRLPCPLCNIYSSGWILSILATNDHYHERMCRTQWPLTLTYIFKVIWPWLRKWCSLCSVYSSGWILFIFSTNGHYHYRVCRVLSFFHNLKIWILGKFFKFFGLDLEKKIYSSRWILSIFSTNHHYYQRVCGM